MDELEGLLKTGLDFRGGEVNEEAYCNASK